MHCVCKCIWIDLLRCVHYIYHYLISLLCFLHFVLVEFLKLREKYSFFQMCEDARRLRRPILILAIRDRTNQRAHAMLQKQLIESNYLRDLANTSFVVYGLYYNDRNRAEPGEAQLRGVLNMPRSSQVSLWVLSVLHDHNIQVNSRVSTSTSFTASQLSSFL